MAWLVLPGALGDFIKWPSSKSHKHWPRGAMVACAGARVRCDGMKSVKTYWFEMGRIIRRIIRNTPYNTISKAPYRIYRIVLGNSAYAHTSHIAPAFLVKSQIEFSPLRFRVAAVIRLCHWSETHSTFELIYKAPPIALCVTRHFS